MWDDVEPGNGGQITYSFIRDGTAPTFTVSKSQSNIGNTQATRVNVSVGGTISDANGIDDAELSVRTHVAGACPTANDDDLNLAATRVSGNKRDLSSNGSTTITFDETFTVTAPSAGDVSGTDPFVEEALCFYLYTEDVATDEDGDGPGNSAMYDVGSFSVSWLNPGPAHRIGAANWDPDASPPAATTAITADEPLKATEGATDGAQFVVTLSSPADAALTVRLSAPTTVSFTPSSVTIALGETESDPATVTAAHDRNTGSEKVEITATVSGGTNYNRSSGKVAVLTVDDDLNLVVSPTSVNEHNALAEGTPALVLVEVFWPAGAERPDLTANAMEVALGATGGTAAAADFTFREIEISGGRIAPYDAANTEASSVTLQPSTSNEQRGYWYAWLVPNDDTEDEEPETIQIGATPASEASRMEPGMITIMDADPEVTLSIDAVDEGADEVTMTVTATAAGPMPGIFEIPATAWEALSDDMTEAGYAFVATGTLTIDRNQTEGTVSVTVTTPEDDDKEDGMFMVSLTDASVTLAGAANDQGEVTVGMLTVTVVDNDKDDG